jgi:tetratricopeptide (TPR) repeat protein
LWQAWAVYEENHGKLEIARDLFERALELDSYNPYVCHAYGLMEKTKCQLTTKAKTLWERALTKTSTAALVCSLGQVLIEERQYDPARTLYKTHLKQLKHPKDKMEVYLALAWLEERYCQNYDQAERLLKQALELFPSSSLAHVALARLEGRRRQDKTEGKKATVQRLANACINLEREQSVIDKDSGTSSGHNKHKQNDSNNPQDGRIFNAWAHLEVQDRKFDKAQKILARGIARYPNDPMVGFAFAFVFALYRRCVSVHCKTPR